MESALKLIIFGLGAILFMGIVISTLNIQTKNSKYLEASIKSLKTQVESEKKRLGEARCSDNVELAFAIYVSEHTRWIADIGDSDSSDEDLRLEAKRRQSEVREEADRLIAQYGDRSLNALS